MNCFRACLPPEIINMPENYNDATHSQGQHLHVWPLLTHSAYNRGYVYLNKYLI